jgi:hypothetical protein
LQLVGQTLEDEAVIGMAEIVDAAIKKLWALDETQLKLSKFAPQIQNVYK